MKTLSCFSMGTSTAITNAESIRSSDASRQANLSPPLDLVGSGVQLVNPVELQAWAVFSNEKREDYQNMLDLLGAQPKRAGRYEDTAPEISIQINRGSDVAYCICMINIFIERAVEYGCALQLAVLLPTF